LTITVKTIFSHEKLQLEQFSSKTKIAELNLEKRKRRHKIRQNE
jgi:hypothetical protein